MNRRVLTLVAIAAIAFTGLVGSSVRGDAATAPSSPWSQTNADAAGSRDNRTEATLSTSNVGQIVYRRSVASPPTGQSDCFQGIIAPALVNGYVYTVTGDYLLKVNAATGVTTWR